jgi:hypothetical protein
MSWWTGAKRIAESPHGGRFISACAAANAHPNSFRSTQCRSPLLKYGCDQESSVCRNIPPCTAACCLDCGWAATNGLVADGPVDSAGAALGWFPLEPLLLAAVDFFVAFFISPTFPAGAISCRALRSVNAIKAAFKKAAFTDGVKAVPFKTRLGQRFANARRVLSSFWQDVSRRASFL